MFDFVRKHTKIMMFLMFLLIIPAFVLVGINGFRNFNGAGETVAKVGSVSIHKEEWDAAHKNEVDRIRASNPGIDSKMLDSADARYVTLERMVRERVLAQNAADLHLTVTDLALARALQQDPTIASLRGADGRLDMDRYRQLLATQGLTPEGFEARVRQDLIMREAERAVVDSALAPVRLTNITLNAFFQRREVQTAGFSPADYSAQVNLSDAELQTYYQVNHNQFQVPEMANIEYVVLDLDSIKKGITVSEADLRSYYDQNAERLSGKEERRVSHILITAPKGDVALRQKAHEKAQALLEQVRKAPDTFADVAKKNSQDPGSAASGGDLNYFARGAMVKPFDDAAFVLKKGDISDLVETDFGFHIIKVVDIRTPKQKSFDELRGGIESDLRAQQAQHKYAEVAELFTNTVYEQSDSLKPVADKLKLDIRTATGLLRQPRPDVSGILANPKLLAAVFSADSVDKKRNTEALEIGPNQMVSARVTQYTPARVLPFDEVKTVVREQLTALRAAALAKKDGVAKLADWKQHPDNAKLASAEVVSRDQKLNLSPTVVGAILRADVSSLPAWIGVDLGNKRGYTVVRIAKVLERTPPTPEVAVQERNQYAKWIATAQDHAYVETLKTHYKAQIKVPKPDSAEIAAAMGAE